jgi:hypothetical protein
LPKDSGRVANSVQLAKFRKSRALRLPKEEDSSQRLTQLDRSKYCRVWRQPMFLESFFREVFESINVCKFRRWFKDLGRFEIQRLEASRYLNSFSLETELGRCDMWHPLKSKTLKYNVYENACLGR